MEVQERFCEPNVNFSNAPQQLQEFVPGAGAVDELTEPASAGCGDQHAAVFDSLSSCMVIIAFTVSISLGNDRALVQQVGSVLIRPSASMC